MKHIAVPEGWNEMAEAEKNKFVHDALVKIAANAGLDFGGLTGPAEVVETAEG